MVWPIVAYSLTAWTLIKELRENVATFEMQCYRKAMQCNVRDSYSTRNMYVTNGER